MPGAKKQPLINIDNLGFTIIEIVVTMLIISITVALVVPNFNKVLGNYQLDISAREMASDIRDLQQEALKTQSSALSIMWNITSECYYMMNESTVTKTVQLPVGIDIDTTNFDANKMLLSNNGRPHNYGTVTLKDRTTGKYKYVIVNTLGRVRVSDTFPTS